MRVFSLITFTIFRFSITLYCFVLTPFTFFIFGLSFSKMERILRFILPYLCRINSKVYHLLISCFPAVLIVFIRNPNVLRNISVVCLFYVRIVIAANRNRYCSQNKMFTVVKSGCECRAGFLLIKSKICAMLSVTFNCKCDKIFS